MFYLAYIQNLSNSLWFEIVNFNNYQFPYYLKYTLYVSVKIKLRSLLASE